jgi:crotonobetainyl-CoA:carnitine CoA-transferase CaiB-like acyl-CoA transferase
MMLSDLGATVDKVEEPGGDPYRSFSPVVDGVGLPAAVVNRGKNSIVLDLKSDSGKQQFLDLITRADILIDNWRPGVADRLGLDSATLAAANPTLVHVSISGYGDSGPNYRDRAYDSIVQAQSGVAFLQDANRAQILPTYVADKATSMMVAQTAIAGLLVARTQGVGCYASIAMIDSLAYFNFPDLMLGHSLIGQPESESPRSVAPSVVRTADGFVMVAAASGQQIKAVCEAVDRPSWARELAQLGGGAEFRDEFNRGLEAATRSMTADELVRRLSERDVPAAVVVDAEGHFSHPQIVHNGTYGIATDEIIGAHRYARHPSKFRGVDSTDATKVCHLASVKRTSATDSCS